MNVELVSIKLDPLELLTEDARRLDIQAPLLSDPTEEVSKSYGMAGWTLHGGEPGHVFILVGKDNLVKWVRDYGAETMYVEVDELYQEVLQRLA